MFKKSGDRTHGHDDLGCRLFTRPLDLGKLLDNIESDNVQSIDVASLAALMTDKNSHVSVYDVDPVSDREKDGSDPRRTCIPAASACSFAKITSGVRLLICDRRILGVQRIFVVAPNLVSADKTNRKSAESRVGNVLRCHKLCEIRHAGAYVDLAAR